MPKSITLKRTVIGAVLSAVLASCGTAGTSSAGSTTSSSPKVEGPINIGVAAGLTGYLAGADKPLVAGIKAAAAQINAKGGIGGAKINLIVRDMASTPTQGVTVTNQLILQDHVSALLTGFVSAATSAEAPIVARSQIPMVTASVQPPSGGSYIVSTYPQGSASAQLAINFAKSKLHAKSVGFLYSQTVFGQQGAAVLAAEAKSANLKVIGSEPVATTATDVTAQLSAVKGADVIIDFLTGPTHIIEASNAATLGIKAPIIMNNDSLSTFNVAASKNPNLYFIMPWPQLYPNVPNQAIKQADAVLNEAFVKSGGASAGDISFFGRGWDDMNILAAAMEKSGAVTGPKLMDALTNLTYTGTSAIYKFTPSQHQGMTGTPYAIAEKSGSGFKIAYSQQAS